MWFRIILLFVIVFAVRESFAGADCAALKNEVRSSIHKSKICVQDSDCSVMYFGCPFGCENVVNKTMVPANLQELAAKHAKECGPCFYDCDMPSGRIECHKGLCRREGRPDETSYAD